MPSNRTATSSRASNQMVGVNMGAREEINRGRKERWKRLL